MTARAALDSRTHCEVLFEVLATARGRLLAGRLLKGTDVGRLVLLREISEQRAGLDTAVDVARSLAHPRIAKVLGVVRGENRSYVASEYVPGVALSELSAAARHANTPLEPGVAVHVISEALDGLALAQRMLKENAGVGYTRSFHADTVWLAEYGDVLVTEVGLAPFLSETWPARSEVEASTIDVLTGAVELFQLLTARVMSEAMVASVADHVPLPVAKLLGRALTAPDSFGGVEGLSSALRDLPGEFHADADLVSDELVRVMRPALERRRRTLSALQQVASRGDDEDSTQFFRQADLLESTRGDTVRPPPDAASDAADDESAEFRDRGGLEEPTTLYRRGATPRSTSRLSDNAPSGARGAFRPASVEEDGADRDDHTVHERPPFDVASEPAAASNPDVDSSIFRPHRARMRWIGSAFLLIVLAAVVVAWLKPVWLPRGLVGYSSQQQSD